MLLYNPALVDTSTLGNYDMINIHTTFVKYIMNSAGKMIYFMTIIEEIKIYFTEEWETQ